MATLSDGKNVSHRELTVSFDRMKRFDYFVAQFGSHLVKLKIGTPPRPSATGKNALEKLKHLFKNVHNNIVCRSKVFKQSKPYQIRKLKCHGHITQYYIELK